MLGTERLKELARSYLESSLNEGPFVDEPEFLGKLVEVLARHADDKLVYKWLCISIISSQSP